MFIADNPALTNLHFPQLVFAGEGFEVDNNPSLTSCVVSDCTSDLEEMCVCTECVLDNLVMDACTENRFPTFDHQQHNSEAKILKLPTQDVRALAEDC